MIEYEQMPETFAAAGDAPAKQQDTPVKKRVSLHGLTRTRPATADDFSQPKRGVYGSPFRPTIGPNNELIPAIVSLDVVAAPMPRVRAPRMTRTHCEKGHELTPENIIVAEYKNGERDPKRVKRCKICADAYEASKNQCKNGHPRTPENTYYFKGKSSGCLICRKELRARKKPELAQI